MLCVCLGSCLLVGGLSSGWRVFGLLVALVELLLMLCVCLESCLLVGGFVNFLLRWLSCCAGSAEGEWKLRVKRWEVQLI